MNSANFLNCTTLVDLLRYRALSQPNQLAYTFLVNGETEEVSLTHQELDQKARTIAVVLQSMKARGERALLLYPPGLEFITAFFGCLYAGLVAVPAYPPRRNQRMIRLQGIVSDAQAQIALSTSHILATIEQSFPEYPELKALRCIATDNIVSSEALNWEAPILHGSTLAFLQYTSGSTGTPKGVMVSHGNLLHNLALIHKCFGHTPNSQGVIWLPPYHDMGLIGGVLQPIYGGFPLILMSPVEFLQKPLRWLNAISRYKATTSGGPNFAYDLCVQHITPEQRANLDLSSWEVAFNGAEPVRAETLERFARTFAPCGFRLEAFYPCYGMAETTLLVSGGLKTETPVMCRVDGVALEQNSVVEITGEHKDARTVVGCGQSLSDQKIVIVDPQTCTLVSTGKVGEIWVSGPSVTSGYWNRPQETEQVFNAYLTDTNEGPFLCTGDLGFLQDGELFVTGRLKDMIIILGRNHYPQDIELTVERSHPALRPACGAAFAVEIDGSQKLVIVQEVERSYLRKLNANEIIGAVRRVVAEQHDLQVHAVLLLKTASLPKTSSGKVQRSACRAGFLAGSLDVVADWSVNPPSKAEFQHQDADGESFKLQEIFLGKSNSHEPLKSKQKLDNQEAIEAWLISKVAEQLNISPGDIDIQQPLANYGLSSLAAVNISGKLEEWLGRQLSPSLLYDYPTIVALAQHLALEPVVPTNSKVDNSQRIEQEAIAIIGIGCRFPGAKNPEAFWQLLCQGIDAIQEMPPSRWDSGTMNTWWGGFLEQVDEFDAEFFGISPREAETMDPQQRLLLEVTWEALENACLTSAQLAGSQTGVFIGISSYDYSQLLLKQTANPDAYSGTGNALSIAANRLSYILDLRGPSWAVDTACSSSLVAVHHACFSLRQGESQMAIVGGVNLILTPQLTISFSQGKMMAADGRCKTFDAKADGYVRGEGCGVVILKRFSDAKRDGDNILALIRGSAVNQDGRSNGLTAPNGLSQQAVVRQALANAVVRPAEISYVEAHGTGTSLGDPIEVNSLKQVLMEDREPAQRCWIGSVKTNIGHLEAAAGIAGLIKVVLCLQYEEIPPHLHLNELNPHIVLENTPFSIPTKGQKWSRDKHQRLAGVSSFGFGGTNAHVILEEAPKTALVELRVERSKYLLSLSAKSEKALRETAQCYEAFLASNPTTSLGDICFRANMGRSHFDYRLAVVTESHGQLREQLSAFAAGIETVELVSGKVNSQKRRKVGFLFTGQGSQYVGMGRQLYETEPSFRQTLDYCDQILRPYLEKPLLSVLYPEVGETSPLDQTIYSQPALFAFEYALFQLWKSWGVEPTAVMGHSMGEYVAACVAGVFSLENGLKLIAERARLMQSLPSEGEMVAIFASETAIREITPINEEKVSIAAHNGPKNTVISGERQAIKEISAALEAVGIQTQKLVNSHAFHSPLMEPIVAEFHRIAAAVTYKSPQIDMISNLTGERLTAEAISPEYWCHHLLSCVEFDKGLHRLYDSGIHIFLEVGPKPTLLGMGRKCIPKGEGLWLPSLRPGYSDWQQILQSLGELYVSGVQIDWFSFDLDNPHQHLQLPTYPFQRKRYWIQEQNSTMIPEKFGTSESHVDEFSNTKRRDIILSKLRSLTADLLKAVPSEIALDAPLLEIGADSIMLFDAINYVENTYGIKISIRQLFEELTTIDALASYIDQNLPPDWNLADSQSSESLTTAAIAQSAVPKAIAHGAGYSHEAKIAETPLERIMMQQFQVMSQQSQIMSQQLEILRSNGLPTENLLSSQKENFQPAHQKQSPIAEKHVPSVKLESEKTAAKPFLLFSQVEPPQARELSQQQQHHLEALIARYTKRTQKSKQRAQEHRLVLADRRSSVGFRLETKEMLYPIVGYYSQKARIWDIDGNEYVDLTMGFGVHLFGHRAPFIMASVENQFQQTIQIGPQSELAGEVAASICKLTGMERVTFCTSGTEAVMTSLRLARAVTGRDKIVLFKDAYHGHSDGTLAIATTVNGKSHSAPMAPGVPQHVVDDVLVLTYGESQSLEIIKTHAHELAAVLVEPVPSRRPDLQPKAFLQELRQLTRETGIALIFDEVITGFRVHPGGAQAWFGIDADIAIYGKLIGGGMPIGVVAGRSLYMDSIDGGMWNYGDSSYPQAATTFFAGTFAKHPLAMATAHAVCQHLMIQGPALQQQLNERTFELVKTLNTYFEQDAVPIKVTHFASFFRFSLLGNFSYFYQPLELDLLFYHLSEKGVYIWEGRTCFLSTAHTDEDINYVVKAVKHSIEALREGGFFLKYPVNSLKVEKNPGGTLNNLIKPSLTKNTLPNPAFLERQNVTDEKAKKQQEVPLTEAQKQLWVLTQMDEDSSLAYHVSVNLQLIGPFDLVAMGQALQKVVNRHEVLRTTIGSQGDFQQILPFLNTEVSLIDFSSVDICERESKTTEWIKTESCLPFDLVHGSLFRAHVLKLQAQLHLLILTAHHIVIDGWSMGVILEELSTLYSAECQGKIPELEPPMQFQEYRKWQAQQSQTEEMVIHESYWLEKFANSIPVLELPTDRSRPPIKTYKASRETIRIDASLTDKIKEVSLKKRCTLFMMLLSAYTALLHRLTGQDDILVGIPTAARSLAGSAKLVGYCAHILPIRSCLFGCPTFSEHLTTIKNLLIEAYEHQDYPFAKLLNKLEISPDFSQAIKNQFT